MDNKYSQFLSFATILLSTITGILVTLPFAMSSKNFVFILIGLLLGALSGYKRRNSRTFFYIALFSSMTLSTILYFQIIKAS